MYKKDKLAIERTKWAAERTWLANVRTGLAILIGSGTAYHIKLASLYLAVSLSSVGCLWIVFSTLIFVIRVYYLYAYSR